MSATDQWIATFNEYGRDLNKLGCMFVNKLPYVVLESISAVIQNHWSSWKPYAKILIDRRDLNAKEFTEEIIKLGSSVKLSNIINISKKADSFAIKGCLTDCKSLEKLRQRADKDFSKGLIEDIHPDTIRDMAIEIVKSSIDWRLLGDSLGFNNYFCRSFEDPKEIIDCWLSNNLNVSVCRLYFEMEQLGLKNICKFIDAIPLEGIETPIIISGMRFRLRHVTKYDLLHLNELSKANNFQIDWDRVARKAISYAIEDNRNCSSFDLLWKYNGCQMSNFLKDLGNQTGSGLVDKFEQELNDGIFEPTSPGGIKLSQILYLGTESVISYYGLSESGSSVPSGLNFQSGPIKTQILKDKYFGEINFGSSVGFSDFLVLFWQSPFGETLNLREFYHTMVDILKNTKSSYNEYACRDNEFLSIFQKIYHSIKPWRFYDPILAKINLDKESDRKVDSGEEKEIIKEEKNEEIIKEERDDSCGICMDNKIDTIILPCGHLGYCFKCLARLDKCPACNKDIEKRQKVFSLN